MMIGVIKEGAEGEKRVALVPQHVSALKKAGASVVVETGAGVPSGYNDSEYTEAGASISGRREVLSSADILLAVRAGAANPTTGTDDAADVKNGAVLVATLNPYGVDPSFSALAAKNATAFALELVPRITRAQSMDVLSSQANLGGYRSVLLAATHLPKMFPMMMTAAGTVVPAKVFIVGVGVAGLQAIATARRLGAVVRAYDVRPAVKEQVESLGAKFVEIDLEASSAEGSGGYAKQMDEEFYRKQRELMGDVVEDSDVVITTAAIPGKPAPVLITADMVGRMNRGSVIVDMAAERGGNCELTKPNEVIDVDGVLIVGSTNLPSELAYHASQLFSKNVVTFVAELVSEGTIAIDRDDEIVAASIVLDKGKAPSAEMAERIGVESILEKE